MTVQPNGAPQQDATSPEQQKLTLEIEALARKASWRGQLTDWLQAAAIPATIAGVLFSFFFSTSQLHQAEDARTDDRFDKALTRLADEKPAVRISGVSGIRLFIENGEASRRTDAVQFLIDALANEEDPVVQSTIVGVIAELKSLGVDAAATDAALETAIERDRSLTAWLTLQTAPSDAALRQLIARKFAVKPEALGEPIDPAFLNKLTIDDYRSTLPIRRAFADRGGSGTATRLRGLAKAIGALIVEGARVSDFSGIFCEDCDFTPAKNLSNASFDRAYLARAEFSHMVLKGATFRDADLSNTYFFAAQLEGADLSASFFKAEPRLNQFNSGETSDFRSLPMLDCAHLEGANLSGLPLIFISLDIRGSKTRLELEATEMKSAVIAPSTRIDTLGIVLEQRASATTLGNNKSLDRVSRMNLDTKDVALGSYRGTYRDTTYGSGKSKNELALVTNVSDVWDFSRQIDPTLPYGYLPSIPASDSEVQPQLDRFLNVYLKQKSLWNIASLRTLADAGAKLPTCAGDANDCSLPGHPDPQLLVEHW